MDLVNDEPELSALMLGHEEFGKNPKLYVVRETNPSGEPSHSLGSC